MQAIRSFFRILEYLAIGGIVIMSILFFTGHLDFISNLKLFLSAVSLLITLFIFLNCTDDYKTPFEKVYRFIGWLVLLGGIAMIMMIYESIKPEGIWPWLNTLLVLGLFAAQLSEINEMKRSNDVLRLINFVVALSAFVLLVMTIHGNPVSFLLLFILIGLNLLTILSTVLTGKMK